LPDLAGLLAPLERPDPPAGGVPRGDAQGVHWVRPELVYEVVFAEWTGEGRLRHPAWRGLRDDKTPRQVRRE
jgi:bifunctional non-homologous end joining protein LigD